MANSPSTASNEAGATQFFEKTEYGKEDLDIAFAVELLSHGTLSERQLASALTTWTHRGLVAELRRQQHDGIVG